MRLIGVEGYGRIIEHTIDMTFYLKSLVEREEELEVSGKAFLSIATYQGKKVLRAVILNHCTQKEDLELVVNESLEIGRRMVLEGLNL